MVDDDNNISIKNESLTKTLFDFTSQELRIMNTKATKSAPIGQSESPLS